MSATASPPGGGAPGLIWRQTLGVLRARLEDFGVAPETAQELGEAVIIVCALRDRPNSLEQALRLAWREALGQRPWSEMPQGDAIRQAAS